MNLKPDSFYFMRVEPVDVRRYLPRWLNKDATFNAVQEALNWEHEHYRLTLADVAKQFFVETATWGLSDWEKFLKIASKPDADEDLRRRVIRVKRRGGVVLTKENLRLLLADFAPRGSVEVRELGGNLLELVIHDGTFYWDELMEALWEQLPAHLTFNFEINRTLNQTHYVAQLDLHQGDILFDINNVFDAPQPLHIVQSENLRGSQLNDIAFGVDNHSEQTLRIGALELIHGRITFDADIETPDDYTMADFERYIRQRWLKFKQNPVVQHYKHNEHGWDEGDIDEPDDDEFFPVDEDFLRIYWGFNLGDDKFHIRYQTILNPQQNLTGTDINALSQIGTAGKILLHSKKKIPTNGILRALYIKKRTTQIL